MKLLARQQSGQYKGHKEAMNKGIESHQISDEPAEHWKINNFVYLRHRILPASPAIKAKKKKHSNHIYKMPISNGKDKTKIMLVCVMLCDKTKETDQEENCTH